MPAPARVRALATLAALAALPMPTDLPAQAHERAVDALLADHARPGLPGASVLVVHDGRVVLAKGYGLAEVESGTPATATSAFRLASLSKQFTAAAVMLLAADGRLRYDDDLAAHLPALPAWTRGVTVRHALTHTSGLPDYEDFVPDTRTTQVHDAEIPALIARAPGLAFAPGTRWAYSNTGYVLLALLVEQASGRRFADFLRERVFAPLAMTGTVAHEEGRSVVPRRAYGYTVRDGVARRTDQSSTSATLGDGGIYAPVADLARWTQALDAGTLLDPHALRLAWTPPPLAGGPGSPYGEVPYGFGWFVDRERGALRLRHHGQTRGFTNAFLSYPERRLTVIVLTNRTGGAPWTLAERIAALHLGDDGAR